MGEDPEPDGPAKQDEQAAGGSGKQGGRESAADETAAQEAGEGGGEGPGNKVAAGGPEEMQESGRGVRTENGETDCAFDEIEKKGRGG